MLTVMMDLKAEVKRKILPVKPNGAFLEIMLKMQKVRLE